MPPQIKRGGSERGKGRRERGEGGEERSGGKTREDEGETDRPSTEKTEFQIRLESSLSCGGKNYLTTY